MLAPAELALHGVANPKIPMAALDHHADTAPDHDVAGLQGIGVLTMPAAHLPAHIGIDRQEMRARQNLAVGRLRHRRLDEPKAARIGHPVGRTHIDDLAMCRHGGPLSKLDPPTMTPNGGDGKICAPGTADFARPTSIEDRADKVAVRAALQQECNKAQTAFCKLATRTSLVVERLSAAPST
jgi:hypothetical protein